MKRYPGRLGDSALFCSVLFRFARAVAVIGGALLFAGCNTATGNVSDTFALGVDVTGNAGTGIAITITDESGPTLLVNDAGITTLPVSRETTDTVDFSISRTFTVAVSGTAIPAGESFSVTVTYTENSYFEPITRTVDEMTKTNSTAGAANLDYTFPLVVPYQ